MVSNVLLVSSNLRNDEKNIWKDQRSRILPWRYTVERKSCLRPKFAATVAKGRGGERVIDPILVFNVSCDFSSSVC